MKADPTRRDSGKRIAAAESCSIHIFTMNNEIILVLVLVFKNADDREGKPRCMKGKSKKKRERTKITGTIINPLTISPKIRLYSRLCYIFRLASDNSLTPESFSFKPSVMDESTFDSSGGKTIYCF